MKYGLLGRLATESAEETPNIEVSVESDILAEDAFIEASDIAHEAESSYNDMVQASAVAKRAEIQVALSNELLAEPESINAATAAMACESMQLALAALGASSDEYTVSTEAMRTAPVQALEVSQEGIKDTVKKIYEGIKMIFKKIALSVKKLAAKLIVAIDGSSAKAAKMLEDFKKNKGAAPSQKFLDEKDAKSQVVSLGAISYLAKTGFLKLTDKFSAFAKNIEVIKEIHTANVGDLSKLYDLLDAAGDKANVNEVIKSGKFAGVPLQETAKILAGQAVDTMSKIKMPSGATELMLTPTQLDEVDLPEDVYDSSVHFLPTYAKGNSIHGVLVYVVKVDSDSADPASLVSAIKLKNVSVSAINEGDIEAIAKDHMIMGSDEIISTLNVMKSSSKELKAYSTARMKDIDLAMKDIDIAAKRESGIALFNRLSNSEFNQLRMFIAGNYLASIFAMASVTKKTLSAIAVNISYYK